VEEEITVIYRRTSIQSTGSALGLSTKLTVSDSDNIFENEHSVVPFNYQMDGHGDSDEEGRPQSESAVDSNGPTFHQRTSLDVADYDLQSDHDEEEDDRIGPIAPPTVATKHSTASSDAANWDQNKARESLTMSNKVSGDSVDAVTLKMKDRGSIPDSVHSVVDHEDDSDLDLDEDSDLSRLHRSGTVVVHHDSDSGSKLKEPAVIGLPLNAPTVEQHQSSMLSLVRATSDSIRPSSAEEGPNSLESDKLFYAQNASNGHLQRFDPPPTKPSRPQRYQRRGDGVDDELMASVPIGRPHHAVQLTSENLRAHDFDTMDRARRSQHINMTGSAEPYPVGASTQRMQRRERKRSAEKWKYAMAIGGVCAVGMVIGYVMFSNNGRSRSSRGRVSRSDVLMMPKRRKAPILR